MGMQFVRPLTGREGGGVGELVLQARVGEQGDRHSQPGVEEARQTRSGKCARPHGRGDAYSDQSEQNIVNRDANRQELWNEHLQSPSTEALRSPRRLEGAEIEWQDLLCGVVSLCAVRGLSHRVLSGELALFCGACMFECFIVGRAVTLDCRFF